MKRARNLAVVSLMVLCTSVAVASPSFADQPPPVQDATLITGPPNAFGPGVVTADLQHELVLGSTPFVNSDGLVFTDIDVPYLWSGNGSTPTSVLMTPPADLQEEESIYVPDAVTPNGGTAVGGVIFPGELSTAPWAWTPSTGLQMLQLPADTRFGGGAVGVSNDGSVIAGTLSGRFVPSEAAEWKNGTLETLPTSQRWSEANAISGDGSVVIGADGPLSTTLQATSWVNGTEQPLPTGDLDPQSSTATFIAGNGTIFGTATLSSGQVVMLRWAPDGTLTELTPPNGMSVVQLNAIDTTGSAAGGALAPQTTCIFEPDPACNQLPFVWTAQGGFTILPETPDVAENRNTFGDRSTVTGVADGGRVAVGRSVPFESINGFPTQSAFVWSAGSGLVTVDDLMSSFGQPDPDYFAAGAVNPAGTQLLVSGDPPNDALPFDTGTLRLDITPSMDGVTGIQSASASAADATTTPADTATATQATAPQTTPSPGGALAQRLMSLPQDLLTQLQTWPGAASVLGTSLDQPATADPSSAPQPSDSPVSAASAAPSSPGSAQQACPPPAPGFMQCFAEVRPGGMQDPGAAQGQSLPIGYGPADLQSAYNLPSAGGNGQLVAIVDAGDDPNAEADLAVYRKTYGLPPCTTANGCFEKVNQEGQQGPYPPEILTGNWPLEESLDMDMVSAACPNCHIVLVEANTNSVADLAAAAQEASTFNPVAISNSYGTTEFDGMDAFASAYDHPGIAITASSGDSGFGPAEFPAVLATVTAVGGTSLLHQGQGARGWTETAWDGASSGCSTLVAKPSWQTDRDCSMRTTADVSAVADPNTGVAVFDSTPVFGLEGWMVAGGTSASAALVAGVIGLAGNGIAPSFIYEKTQARDLYDIKSGSNGFCGGSYLCTATNGYDGPTGLGTPDGSGAF